MPRCLIVGAGCFGLATAIQLRRRYLEHTGGDRSTIPAIEHLYDKITVIEAGPLVNPLAASNDLNRIVRADYGTDVQYTRLALAAMDQWHEFNAANGGAVYHETGLVILTEAPLPDCQYEHTSYQTMMDNNVPVHRLHTTDTIRERFPLLENTDIFVDGYHNPKAGWVDNGAALAALVRIARELGVELLDYTSMTGIVSDGGSSASGIEVVNTSTTARSIIAADFTIICTGAWMPSLVPYTAALLRPSCQPVLYFTVSDNERELFEHAPVCALSLGSRGYYSFPLSERLLPSINQRVVKVAHHGPGIEMGRSHPGNDRSFHQTIVDRMLAYITTVFPSLTKDNLALSRSCYYCDSLDGDWLIDFHRDYTNVLIASGDSGHAFKFTPVLGELVVGILTGDSHWAEYRKKFQWREPPTSETLDVCRASDAPYEVLVSSEKVVSSK